MCKISVVTAVYNAEAFIGETIESVLSQTCQDWEFLLIDDCSSDRSEEVIREFAQRDSRIRYYRNERNQGQTYSLNKGISLAKGEYIARLDHDDLCLPERFQLQLDYMEAHPDIVLLGSNFSYLINGKVVTKEMMDLYPKNSAEMRFAALFSCPMVHSSFFIRKEALRRNGICYRNFKYAEDYAFIVDMLKIGEIFMLPERLAVYRLFDEQTTKKTSTVTILGERASIICELLERTNLSDKSIIRDATYGKLSTRNDYLRFQEAFLEYMKMCGLDEENVITKKMFRSVFDWQKGKWSLFFFYAGSPLRMKNWLFRHEALSLIKQCVLRLDRYKEVREAEND